MIGREEETGLVLKYGKVSKRRSVESKVHGDITKQQKDWKSTEHAINI